MNPKHVRRCIRESWRELYKEVDAVWGEARRELVVGNDHEDPTTSLIVKRGTTRGDARFFKQSSPQTVVGWRLAVKVLTIFEGDFLIVWNDLIFSRTLEKEDIGQWDGSKMLEMLPGLVVML
ncbi:hypothetical protein [Acidicapsa ligni]|uniref:hypothetical protein n=1 Tax=Acidicapsa ligni TaxID=542300 RepID=UPI0021E03AA0|nr:hypothetical protein [Acidicapsa ligni]